MNGIAVLMTMAVIGVDYGWQPGRDGQLEYIVQIEPALLESLKSGAEIVSEIHPDARGVRRFRIRVGKGELPRVGHLAADTSPTRLSTSDSQNSRTGGGDFVAPTGSSERSGLNLDPSTLPGRNSGTGPSTGAPGILNLPPPPALIGPDGKSSVLVQPGDNRRDFAASDPAAVTASLDDAPVAADNGRGWLNLPPPPEDNDTGSLRGGVGLPPALSAPTNQNPAGSRSGFSFPETPSSWPPGSNTPPTDPPGGSRPVYPVPSPSNNDDAPAPVRSFGGNQGHGSLLEKTAANDRSKNTSSLPAVPASQGRNPNAKPEVTDLASNLDDARGAAAQKPAIDQETAEKLAEMQATRPWLPLVLTSLALFASLAANLYLGWIAVGIYRRYRDMVDELHHARTMLA